MVVTLTCAWEMFILTLPFLGGRINSSYVWMYNSQLNLWIRVASLNKGRWRHKMSVLLGKVKPGTAPALNSPLKEFSFKNPFLRLLYSLL